MSEWKTEANGETIIRTNAWSPPGCHPVGCGLKLHVKDGKLVYVEGDPDHPITRGSLCARCLALPEYIYHPDRVIYPMKRAREDRGKDKWERISWDEAFDMIAENVRRIDKEYGMQAVQTFHGTGREACNYIAALTFLALGTPNTCFPQPGEACYGPRASVMAYLMGGGYPEIDYACRFEDRYDHPGWNPPEYVVLWGKEPLKSNPDGFWGHVILDLMRLGTKVIMIDPRMTWLGTRCDKVLQIRPGTDAALALAMLNVIVNEDIYDHEYVEYWCYGFDELKDRVQQYTPEWAAEITWLPAEEIYAFAREFALGKGSAICWGLAVDQQKNGTQLCQAIISLLAITGNIDSPGGCTLGKPITDNILLDIAQVAIDAGTLDADLYKNRTSTKEYPGFTTIMNGTLADCTLTAMKNGEVKMCFFQSSNVVGGAAATKQGEWLEAFKQTEFNVITDTFHNATSMGCCDLFLPLATFAEHDGFVEPHYGLNAAFQAPIVKAIEVGETKSDIEIMMGIGKRLHPEYWNKYEDATDFLEDGIIPEGMTWEQFRDGGLILEEEVYHKEAQGLNRFDGEPGFMTPTGRIELYSTAFANFGEDPLPFYEEPPRSPISTPDVFEEYPFIFTSGARTYASFHSEHRQIDSLREIVPDPLFEIHKDRAEELGIKEGDWCYIETVFGRCKQRAQLVETLDPRVIHVMHAWWYPEKDPEEPSLYGYDISNANQCTTDYVCSNLGFGDTYKCELCKVYKAED